MMRCGDIQQGPNPTALERTDSMYLPVDPYREIMPEEMTTDELRRGLCHRCGGRVDVCKTCAGGCRWGREMVRRMENELDA